MKIKTRKMKINRKTKTKKIKRKISSSSRENRLRLTGIVRSSLAQLNLYKKYCNVLRDDGEFIYYYKLTPEKHPHIHYGVDLMHFPQGNVHYMGFPGGSENKVDDMMLHNDILDNLNSMKKSVRSQNELDNVGQRAFVKLFEIMIQKIKKNTIKYCNLI